MNTNSAKKAVAAGALVLAGLGSGAVLFSTGAANAATEGTSTAPSASSTATPGATASKGHAGETPLTGTTAEKVKAAALAKYPGATIDRLETDSDGVYEAHIVTAAGANVIVQVGADFAVTGTQQGGGGDHDGDGPGATAGTASTS